MVSGIEFRPPRDEDIPGLIELSNTEHLEEGDAPTADEATIRNSWGSPGFDRAEHARLALEGGRLVGRASIWPKDGQVRAHGYVHPDARGRGIGAYLLDWTIATARSAERVTDYRVGAMSNNDAAIELFTSRGMRHDRSFYTMRHPSPSGAPEPVLPEGITFVSLKGTELAEAAVVAHDGSFIDHWNFSPADVNEYLNWMKHPDDDPDLWIVAARGDEIAGMCICFLEGGGIEGVLGQIGVTRPFRRLGLGRALTLEGLRRVGARGVPHATLGVDAENPTGALRLYTSCGFEIHSEARAYHLTL